MLHICSSMLQNQLFLTQGTLKHPEKQEYCLLQNIHTILSHFYENTRYAAFSLFCSNYAAVCCKKCIFGMSTRAHWFYHAKIPPYTKNHAFFKICSRVFILGPNSLQYKGHGLFSCWFCDYFCCCCFNEWKVIPIEAVALAVVQAPRYKIRERGYAVVP